MESEISDRQLSFYTFYILHEICTFQLHCRCLCHICDDTHPLCTWISPLAVCCETWWWRIKLWHWPLLCLTVTDVLLCIAFVDFIPINCWLLTLLKWTSALYFYIKAWNISSLRSASTVYCLYCTMPLLAVEKTVQRVDVLWCKCVTIIRRKGNKMTNDAGYTRQITVVEQQWRLWS